MSKPKQPRKRRKKYGDKFEQEMRQLIQNYRDYKLVCEYKDKADNNVNKAADILSEKGSSVKLRNRAKKLYTYSKEILDIISSIYPTISVVADQSVQKLYKGYELLIYKRINYYKKTRRDLRDTDDLYSSALIAFTKALDGFDLSKNIKFSTYLTNGLRNELIGSYRKLVRQSEIEACNFASYFHKNNNEIDIAPVDDSNDNATVDNSIQCDDLMNGDSYNDIVNLDESFRISEFIRNISDLTLEESLYFLMTAGIDTNSYTKKEIKKMFNLNESYLDGSRLKVFQAYQSEFIK